MPEIVRRPWHWASEFPITVFRFSTWARFAFLEPMLFESWDTTGRLLCFAWCRDHQVRSSKSEVKLRFQLCGEHENEDEEEDENEDEDEVEDEDDFDHENEDDFDSEDEDEDEDEVEDEVEDEDDFDHEDEDEDEDEFEDEVDFDHEDEAVVLVVIFSECIMAIH
eukprot:s575_g15.t1